jgi:hypothetical protein
MKVRIPKNNTLRLGGIPSEDLLMELVYRMRNGEENIGHRTTANTEVISTPEVWNIQIEVE